MARNSQRAAGAREGLRAGPNDNYVQISGLVFEVTMSASLIADKINAALTAEREKHEPEPHEPEIHLSHGLEHEAQV